MSRTTSEQNTVLDEEHLEKLHTFLQECLEDAVQASSANIKQPFTQTNSIKKNIPAIHQSVNNEPLRPLTINQSIITMTKLQTASDL